MKNPMPLKIRLKVIGVILVVFLCLYVIGRDPYLIGWLANNYFLFVWVPICILLLFKMSACAWCITGGSFLGIAAGQGAQQLKLLLFKGSADENALYWGIPVWIAVVLLAAALGVYLEIRQRKKTAEPKIDSAEKDNKASEK